MVTIVFLLFFLFPSLTLAEPQELPEVQTYDQLARAILGTRQTTNPENKRERVREAWTIGKLIELHAAEYRLWKDYPAYLFKNLSKDVNLSWGELRRMRNFARFYPDQAPPQDLDWWHYQALMDIRDPIQREALAVRDEKEKWTSDELQAELKKLRLKYQTLEKAPISPSLLEKLNYHRATVTSVIDGDTFEANVDLGFGLTFDATFRIRALNSPELGTEKGIVTKKFLVEQLKKTKGQVILKAEMKDQYGRWLADVWMIENSDYVSLHRKLVKAGLAAEAESRYQN